MRPFSLPPSQNLISFFTMCHFRYHNPIDPSQGVKMMVANSSCSWRPGGGKAPALLSVSKEARNIASNRYAICFEMYHRDKNYEIFVNCAIDTVYCKNQLPNMIRMNEIRSYPINFIIPEGEVSREWNLKTWTLGIKNLVVNLDEAVAAPYVFTPPHVFVPPNTGPPPNKKRRQSLWTKLKKICPELEELCIVLRPNPKKHHSLEDLVEVPDFSNVSEVQQSMITQVRRAHQNQLAKGNFLGLTIKFLQLSSSASLAEDRPLLVPDHPHGSGKRLKDYKKPTRRVIRH